jgi:hypothetical protein
MHWTWRQEVIDMFEKRAKYEAKMESIRKGDRVPDDSPHPSGNEEEVPYDPHSRNCFLCQHSARSQETAELGGVIDKFIDNCRERGFEAACRAFERYYDENYRDALESTRFPWPAARIMWHFMYEATNRQLRALYLENQLQKAEVLIADSLGLLEEATGEVHINMENMLTLSKLIDNDVKMVKMLEAAGSSAGDGASKGRAK